VHARLSRVRAKSRLQKGFSDRRYRLLIETLVSARQTAGRSQADVARALGKPQQFVSRYELGERRLDVFEFLDVANCLGLDGLAAVQGVLGKAAR
jgi:transcriptional regulator with XRE-family HTH domain